MPDMTQFDALAARIREAKRADAAALAARIHADAKWKATNEYLTGLVKEMSALTTTMVNNATHVGGVDNDPA